MFRRCFVVFAGLALAACDRPTAPTATALKSGANVLYAQANTTKFNEVLDVEGSAENTCNGDVVFLSGRGHLVITVTDNGTGFDLKIHVNFDDLKGVGAPSGARYHLNGTQNAREHDIFIPNFAFQGRFNINQELVSQGTEPNLITHVTQYYSFDGTDFTVTNTRFSIECRG